jgi:polyisoprenoid-binding protein YceI
MATTTWAIDPTHSEIHFKVKHLVISTVTGSFKTFSGTATSETEDFENAQVNFTIDVNSIDTNQAQRDAHLRSADFFETDKYPTIDFVSTSFKKAKGDDYKLSGNLTMHGVTRPVELDVEYGGSDKDGYGNLKHGFEVTAKINRKEFGLTYNSITEAGGLTLGEEIKLIANVQVAQLAQAEEVAA